ncbi:c-type cytochrome [Thalassomonas haliotis]|uniref:C-type cytochrome n=1 Tax=Thalassomonas haliotis TaxID=485448 RepID=A0ABY7V7D0_9GAMM|nr:c-type cytochrome [Thalassomonas haliotis]WDE09511.1 c-type cytochrome [Thalassomonas haliotis]
MKKLMLALSLSLSFSATATAADGKALYTQKLCGTCHGAEGKAPITPMYPKLNGQNATYLLNQMKDIKSGKRNNGLSMTMKPMVATVSESDMAAIADYLAQVK